MDTNKVIAIKELIKLQSRISRLAEYGVDSKKLNQDIDDELNRLRGIADE